MSKNIVDTKLKLLGLFMENIEVESQRQIEKWGIQDRHPFEWAMWATEEFGEFIQAVNEFNYGRETTTIHILKEGIQTVTLIFKMLEGYLNMKEAERT